MEDGTDIVIKVDTDQLLSAADDVEKRIRQLEKSFADMEEKISSTLNFWEGEGASSFIAAYRGKREMVNTALRRFRENAVDLRVIAGVYTQSERDATENVAVLPSDCIS